MRYVWRNGAWRDRDGNEMETSGQVCAPMIQSDTKPYMSVVSNKMIDGRSARREDLKRSGCREVDPSEYKVESASTEKWAKRLGVPHVPVKPVERLPNYVGPINPNARG